MNKIYIGNLSYQMTEEELQAAFEQFGAIDAVNIITDRGTGQSKGFGFITFGDNSAAQSALELDGSEINGRKVKVNIAREKTER